MHCNKKNSGTKSQSLDQSLEVGSRRLGCSAKNCSVDVCAQAEAWALRPLLPSPAGLLLQCRLILFFRSAKHLQLHTELVGAVDG